MKNIINKIIKWSEGKKTPAGIILHVGLAALTLFTGKISLSESLKYHGYIAAITGVGIGHKIGRNEKTKKIINKIKSHNNKI